VEFFSSLEPKMFSRNLFRFSTRFSPQIFQGLRRNVTNFPQVKQNISRSLIVGGVCFGLTSLVYQQQLFAAENVPVVGLPGTRHERTFIAIKPDGVERDLIGDIISRFEKRGFKLVGIKVLCPTQSFAEQHYDDLKTRPFFPGLVKYFSSGPVVAMVWEGSGVIVQGRKLIGATNPAQAEPGSIRGDLCISVGRNIIHGSDSIEAANHEISLWFNEKEIANYERSNAGWVYDKL